MPGKIKLKYGHKFYEFSLPHGADVLEINEPGPCIDMEKFENDLGKALPADLSLCRSIAIVIADKTRTCAYPEYLPRIVDVLLKNGAETKSIRFFIAYGTHEKQSTSQCHDAYGGIYFKYPFIHHDSRDKSIFTFVGETGYGTRVHMRKDLLECDLVISFGAISHHYFAGYGGGRKLIFPGLGYISDIYHNHSLFLDHTGKTTNTGCRPGNLENNPVAEDLMQIDNMLDIPRISIHGILDSSGKLCRLIVGKTYEDFLRACKMLDSFYMTGPAKRYGFILASCGGFPRDINMIQAHKSIHNASMFVKDSGCLALMAECRDGIGSEPFMQYLGCNNTATLFDKLAKSYNGNAGTALSMMLKTERIDIFLKTSLKDGQCRHMGVKKIDIAKINSLIERHGNDMACIKSAGLLVQPN
jgi:nickel-dependent lactate racemase